LRQMKKFNRNRTRLLVICQDDRLSSELVTLLTGYGYYVDYVKSRKEGIIKFGQHKQAIVIIDAASLPKFPQHLIQMFRFYTINPKIMIVATKEEEQKIYPFLDKGVFDIIQVPLRFEYIDFNLRRLVAYDRVCAQYTFLQFVLQFLYLSSPIWIYFIIALTKTLW
jgi:DNA-binding response OmpR family regulator